MNIGDDLLVILSSYHGGYRLMRRRMSGDTRPAFPKPLQNTSESTLKVTLSRLKKKGFVENHSGNWNITENGRNFLTKRLRIFSHAKNQDTSLDKNAKKLIIIFDIPEHFKKKRDWLRFKLEGIGFRMVQRSVWIGPMPLSEDLIAEFELARIIPYLKFFEAKEADIV